VDARIVLERLLLALGGRSDEATLAGALAAAGVLASRADRPPQPTARLLEGNEEPRLGPPLLRWSDPTAMLVPHDTFGYIGWRFLGDWWSREAGAASQLLRGVRLSVTADSSEDRIPVEAVRLLRAAPGVVAVSAALPAWAATPALRPAWTWPLRLSIGDGWRSGPARSLVHRTEFDRVVDRGEAP
jgi:hypothetical protein